MGKTAYIFPGQGSQGVGMGNDLYRDFDAVREAFNAVDSALGFELSKMCFAGTEADLALTENTQPAILTASVAAYIAFREAGGAAPDYVAGHSLGEYSALVAAGGLTLREAAITVRNRGRYMQEAVPVGVGAMAAVLGMDATSVSEICSEAAQGGVCSAANINSPKQTVIAGHKDAVERACELLKSAGAKRTIMLNVSAPFHCALMMPAQERLAVDLKSTAFSDLDFPLVENVSASINSAAERIPTALAEQVTSPVRWLGCVEFLTQAGVDTFIELGPGKVLTGLVRQIDPDVRFFNVSDSKSLSDTLSNF